MTMNDNKTCKYNNEDRLSCNFLFVSLYLSHFGGSLYELTWPGGGGEGGGARQLARG